MKIIADIFWILILTTISGSILLCICRIFRTVIDRLGSISFVYYLMRVASLTYLIPIVPTVIFAYVYTKNDGAYILYFGNENINIVICLLVAVWLIGLCKNMLEFIKNYMVMRYMLKNAYPADMKLESEFMAVRDILGMRGKHIPIVEMDDINTPAVTGMFKAVVIVPTEHALDDGDLRLALAHEAVHIRFHDNLIKLFTMLAVAINWYNPLAKKLVKELDEWNEYHCDVYTCRKLDIMKEYIEMLVKIVLEADNRAVNKNMINITNAAGRDKPMIIRRIEHLMKYFEKKSKTKRLIASVCMVFSIVLSTSGIAMASDTCIRTGNAITWETADVAYYEYDNDDYILYEDTEDDGLIEVEGEVVSTYASGTSYTFSWSVPNGHRYVTKGYSMDKGDSISVAVTAVPSNKTVKVGVVTPSGGYMYINVTSAGAYTFPCETSGKYRVFVGNNTGVTMRVSGSYALNYN